MTMRILLVLLLYIVFPNIGLSNSNAPNFQGVWQGELVIHEKGTPLQILITKSSTGDYDFTYTFWNKTFYKSDKNTIDISNQNIDISLSDFGIDITGHLSGSSQLVGQLTFMGVSQKITLSKANQSKLPEKSKRQKMNVAVFMFDGVDTLDWAGPLEVFDYALGFNTYTVAADNRTITNDAYEVVTNYNFDDMPTPDILIIPGGDVTRLFKDELTSKWLVEQTKTASHVLSVCNASTYLAANNLLNGLEATTHFFWMNWLNKLSQKHNFAVNENARFVDNGKIITTAGVSSGIDGALHLVAKLKGLEHAKLAAKFMEYRWHPEKDYEKP